ncbi:hypothetical protein ATK23_0498 [Glutamicibacter mysorens]|uniref:Uncharacterized protein n=1 Tax=Glutamicibacter mysorens TaxID=257984 RepID=A0ABX4MVH8_9MICC|nr:hypothetical protein [Glutamicibacter nicotianae]PJJ43315.1 hypothetical protein ATK23_0498 [Glutamicibacter mysorens]
MTLNFYTGTVGAVQKIIASNHNWFEAIIPEV